MFLSLYSVYCLCVNARCTAATGCQPNCGSIYTSYHIVNTQAFRLTQWEGSVVSQGDVDGTDGQGAFLFMQTFDLCDVTCELGLQG
jgi:hypothetical protein